MSTVIVSVSEMQQALREAVAYRRSVSLRSKRASQRLHSCGLDLICTCRSLSAQGSCLLCETLAYTLLVTCEVSPANEPLVAIRVETLVRVRPVRVVYLSVLAVVVCPLEPFVA
jgi:hypothetical protein